MTTFDPTHETWHLSNDDDDGYADQTVVDDTGQWLAQYMVSLECPAEAVDAVDARCAARARLASAAPDMARMLLEIEWASRDVALECPKCRVREDSGHGPNCALIAALRKAGLR